MDRKFILAVIGLTVSVPAHAAGFAALPASIAAITAKQGAPAQPHCAALVAPASGALSDQSAALSVSKASAILGGQASRLELIAREQAGGGTPGEGLSPALGPNPCPQFFQPKTTIPTFAPGLGQHVYGAEDFLASKRLAVRRTSFDSAWSRVKHDGLSRGLRARLAGDVTAAGPEARISAVNAWANAKIRYVEDRELYGKADYWASAGATLKRGAGDCEDIAILKMQMLAALGIERKDMYLTIARDTLRGADHALLVVRQGGQSWLLDNNTDRLLDAAQSYDYRPILSFSETGKWVHGY